MNEIPSQVLEGLRGILHRGPDDDLDLVARLDLEGLVPHVEVVDDVVDGDDGRVHLLGDGVKALEGPAMDGVFDKQCETIDRCPQAGLSFRIGHEFTTNLRS